MNKERWVNFKLEFDFSRLRDEKKMKKRRLNFKVRESISKFLDSFVNIEKTKLFMPH